MNGLPDSFWFFPVYVKGIGRNESPVESDIARS